MSPVPAKQRTPAPPNRFRRAQRRRSRVYSRNSVKSKIHGKNTLFPRSRGNFVEKPSPTRCDRTDGRCRTRATTDGKTEKGSRGVGFGPAAARPAPATTVAHKSGSRINQRGIEAGRRPFHAREIFPASAHARLIQFPALNFVKGKPP